VNEGAKILSLSTDSQKPVSGNMGRMRDTSLESVQHCILGLLQFWREDFKGYLC